MAVINSGWGQLLSHSGALGVVGGWLQCSGPAGLSGEVEAALSAETSGAQKMAEEDDDPPQEAEPGPHPPSVQGEAKAHQAPVAVSPHRKPDGGDSSTQSWKTRSRLELLLLPPSEEGGGEGDSHPRRGKARPPPGSAAAAPWTSRSAA